MKDLISTEIIFFNCELIRIQNHILELSSDFCSWRGRVSEQQSNISDL